MPVQDEEQKPSIEIDTHETPSKSPDDANLGVDIFCYGNELLQNILKDFIDVKSLS